MPKQSPDSSAPARALSKTQWKGVTQTLRSQFQFDSLRPGQEEIIKSVLAGKNTLAIMPTGAGKSLCYQLPALQLKGTTIVISPLISLMKDQREKVEDKGISAVELNSTLSASDASENLESILNNQAEILYVTPERFCNPEFLQSIKKTKIDFIVIDEAHCVSQWGHDFRPAYLSVGETIRILNSPPVLALTATATDAVAHDIQKQLGLKELSVFRTSIMRPNLFFEARYLAKAADKMPALMDILKQMGNSCGIIYTATVAAAENIHETLSEKGIQSILYHGKLSAKQREQNQNDFMSSENAIMIATNAFGMGIDKPNIRYVVHFQFPSSLEAYYQEAGRAGRDGQAAHCILLYLKKDKSTQSLFLASKYPSSEDVIKVYTALTALTENSKEPLDRKTAEHVLGELLPVKKIAVILSLLKSGNVISEAKTKGIRVLKNNLNEKDLADIAQFYQERKEADKTKLNQVIMYAQSALCRWRSLLNYFNEVPESDICGHCDNCKKPIKIETSLELRNIS